MIITPDILLLPIILSLSLLITYKIGQALGLRYSLSLGLFCWHSVLCVYYWFFAKTNPADSNKYYEVALHGVYDWSPGTRFVESFTTLFVSGLGIGKLATFLVYNIFGVVGLLLVAHALLIQWPIHRGWRSVIPLIILLMPGLSFWSSAIGKDAPAFFAACLATYAFQDVQRRKLYFALAVLVMFAVRPHIAAMMFLSASITLLSVKQISTASRIALIFLITTATVIVLPFVVTYVGLEKEISTEIIGEYIATRQSYNMEGGGAVDISSLPLPLKMFTYLFRPLFIDAHGLFGLVASIENAFFLLVFASFFIRGIMGVLRDTTASIRYNLVFFCVGLFVFSTTTANLGIAVRQKTMIVPSIFILIAFTANQVWTKRRNGQSSARRQATRNSAVGLNLQFLDFKISRTSMRDEHGNVEGQEINPLKLLQVLVKRKILIMKVCTLAVVISLGYSLTLPNIYSATATVLPPQKDAGGLSTLLGQSGLAGLATSGLGGGSDLYVGILNSRSVGDAVIKKLDLDQVYQTETLEATRACLRGSLMVQAGKDGIISITTSDEDPKRSALLANAFVEELGNITIKLNLSKAGTERVFLEKRLELVKKDLKVAEDDLRLFAQQNKIVQVETQAKASIEAIAQMKAALASSEVRLSVLRSNQTEQSPEVRALMTGINRQRSELGRLAGNYDNALGIPSVGSVPRVGLEYSRKMRELKTQEAIFEQMTKQYEIAKLSEAKDSSTFQILDEAVVPVKKSKPSRALIVIFATVIAFFVSVFSAFLLEYLSKMSDEDRKLFDSIKKQALALKR